jgi:hypothetical protein
MFEIFREISVDAFVIDTYFWSESNFFLASTIQFLGWDVSENSLC